MKKIIKSAEPNELKEYRETTPGAHYDSMPSKRELRASLLAEQGHICAFCMRRIPFKDATEKETSKIAHLKSRTAPAYRHLSLDYDNMVLCCSGAISTDYHCDKKQGNSSLSFSLFRDNIFETLSYASKDGAIKSSNKQYDTEINDILNLNNALLKANRRIVITEVISFLNATKWNRNKLSDLLEFWGNKDADGKYKPYCGVVTCYINKKLTHVRV